MSGHTSRGAVLLHRGWSRTLARLRRFGQRRTTAVLVFGILGLGGSALVGIIQGPPLPRIHDEFSYLLAADTFASGRLANPTHPLWPHFETFHVLQQPTYASKYPPGQGAILGLGQAITGHPAAGVWLSIGLLAGAIAWMSLVWLPPAWGIVVTSFFLVQVSWFSYWAQSYWGGAVAALGGALALGAVRALRASPKARYGLILGVGLGMLAISRPFEGALLGASVVGILAWEVLKARSIVREPIVRFGLLPALLVAGLFLGLLGYYNREVTGSALRLPYQVYEEQYSPVPSLLVQEPGPRRDYRHRELDMFWNEWARERHEAQRGLLSFASAATRKIVVQLLFFLGPGVVALFVLPRVLTDPWLARATSILALIVGATLLTRQGFPHYVAPATGAFYIVLGACLVKLRRRTPRSGRPDLSLIIVLGLLLYASFRITAYLASERSSFSLQRAEIAKFLESQPARDLVLVEYREGHSVHEEWVYNKADIDASEVIWARSMGDLGNRDLLDYFSDRTIWSLSVGEDVRLERMEAQSGRAD